MNCAPDSTRTPSHRSYTSTYNSLGIYGAIPLRPLSLYGTLFGASLPCLAGSVDMGPRSSKPSAGEPEDISPDPRAIVDYPKGRTFAEAGVLYLQSVPDLLLEQKDWRQGTTSHVHGSIYKGQKAAVKQVR